MHISLKTSHLEEVPLGPFAEQLQLVKNNK